MKPNKEYKTYVIVFFIAIFILLLFLTNIYVCPFVYITGIPCPMCGMTRAFISLFHLNLKDAFYYHALWPVVLIVLPTYLVLKAKKIKIDKRLENTISIIIALLFLVYYIYRHIIGSPIVEIHFKESLLYKIYCLLF